MHRRQKTLRKHGQIQHKGIAGYFPMRSNARNVSVWNRYLKHTCTGEIQTVVKRYSSRAHPQHPLIHLEQNPAENAGCAQQLFALHLSLSFPWCVSTIVSQRKPKYKYQDIFSHDLWLPLDIKPSVTPQIMVFILAFVSKRSIKGCPD